MRQKFKHLHKLIGKLFYYLSTPIRWLMLSHTVRVYAVIIYDSRALLVKNWFGKGEWSLPGGGMRPWERAEDALIRELHEEIGLAISKGSASFFKEGFIKDTFGGKHYMLFKLELKNEPDIKIRKSEITEISWQPVSMIGHNDSVSDEVFEAFNGSVTK